MGTKLELNDTLQLTTEQGFPAQILNLDKHLTTPVKTEDVREQTFQFTKPEARFFHLDPVRVFLVHNIDGKWLCWGHALIQSQSISKVESQGDAWQEGDWQTTGTFKIIDVFEPSYQRIFTGRETPAGKSYFHGK